MEPRPTPLAKNLIGQRLRLLRQCLLIVKRGLSLGILAAGCTVWPAFSAQEAVPASGPLSLAADERPAGLPQAGRANFRQERPSEEARQVADWALDSGDNRRMPFLIVDKAQARVFVFDALGQLRGAAPALLGLAIGDDSVPGIGERKLSSIRPEERTTPAGRFEAALDSNLRGGEILWVDYDTAVSLHPVITSNAAERRAERLATPSPLDNRVSYGCINVPVPFFKNVVNPAFTGTSGIVYVLPETRSAREVFGSYDVDERQRQLTVAGRAAPAQVRPQAGRPPAQ